MNSNLKTLLKAIYRFIRLQLKEYLLFKKGGRKILRIKNNHSLKVEFGASGKREGWITIGLNSEADIQFDIRYSLPFSDSSVEQVYSSHLLEHLEHKDILNFLYEIKRILKNKGQLLICIPDTSIYIQLSQNDHLIQDLLKDQKGLTSKSFRELVEKNNPFFKYYSPLSILNYIAYMNGEHKYMFDKDEIIGMLKHVGFIKVSERPFDGTLDLKIREWESIHILAVK